MYVTKEMNGADHSAIFSMRVTTHCTVHSITYRYSWIRYPVYSKYNISVECNITGKVKVKVALLHSTLYYK
jgi:hypothetical protein